MNRYPKSTQDGPDVTTTSSTPPRPKTMGETVAKADADSTQMSNDNAHTDAQIRSYYTDVDVLHADRDVRGEELTRDELAEGDTVVVEWEPYAWFTRWTTVGGRVVATVVDAQPAMEDPDITLAVIGTDGETTTRLTDNGLSGHVMGDARFNSDTPDYSDVGRGAAYYALDSDETNADVEQARADALADAPEPMGNGTPMTDGGRETHNTDDDGIAVPHMPHDATPEQVREAARGDEVVHLDADDATLMTDGGRDVDAEAERHAGADADLDGLGYRERRASSDTLDIAGEIHADADVQADIDALEDGESRDGDGGSRPVPPHVDAPDDGEVGEDVTVRMYVPEASGQAGAASRMAAERFGGYTRLQARGGWVDDGGELVEEATHVFLIHVTADADAVVNGRTHAAARKYARDLFVKLLAAGEDMVMAEVDGEVLTEVA